MKIKKHSKLNAKRKTNTIIIIMSFKDEKINNDDLHDWTCHQSRQHEPYAGNWWDFQSSNDQFVVAI